MRFILPASVALIIALLFIDIYSLSRPARDFDLRKPSSPSPLQVFTPTASPAPDLTSAAISTLAPRTEAAIKTQATREVLTKVEPTEETAPEVLTKVEPTDQAAAEKPTKVEPADQAAAEVLTKIEPAGRTARAQVPPPKKKRVVRKYSRDDDPGNPVWWLWGLSDVHLSGGSLHLSRISR